MYGRRGNFSGCKRCSRLTRPVAVALLEQEEKEIAIEPALSPPQSRALTEEEQAFADALCRKIGTVLRPEAHAR